MASELNRQVLIGRLTRDPELKSTNNGGYFCRFTLANNTSVKRGNEFKDEVGYFDCVIWGKRAETFHKYVSKGHKIAIEGRLKWESWEGSDGKKHSKISIQVSEFYFLEKRGDGQRPDGGAGTYAGPEGDDDIPF